MSTVQQCVSGDLYRCVEDLYYVYCKDFLNTQYHLIANIDDSFLHSESVLKQFAINEAGDILIPDKYFAISFTSPKGLHLNCGDVIGTTHKSYPVGDVFEFRNYDSQGIEVWINRSTNMMIISNISKYLIPITSKERVSMNLQDLI